MRRTNGGIKISEFLEDSTIDADGLLTFVQDSTNYKIPYSDFLANLGVSGSIEAQGDMPVTPILNVDGTVNYIRGLQDGPGIYTEVSVTDGITIQHNFTVDSTGEPLMTGASDPSPVIVSLVAWTGIGLTSTNDTIEIEATSPGITRYGLATMHGNSTNTVIATVSVPVTIAGTFSAGLESDFLVAPSGRITYLGDTTLIFAVSLSACLDTDSGTKQCGILIGKNGTPIASSQLDATVANGAEKQMSTTYLVSLAQNDYIQGFVVNDTDDVDLLVHSCVFQVHG